MDILSILEQAQKGNYQSYEQLLQTLKNNPDLILSLFDQLALKSTPAPLRDLLGIFVKNLLSESFFQAWWLGYREPSKIVSFLLAIDDLPKVTSMVLSNILAIESKAGINNALTLLMSSKNIVSIHSLGFFIENSRTVPQVLANYIAEILPVLLQTDKTFSLKIFQQCAKHLAFSPNLLNYFEVIVEMANEEDSVLKIEVFKSIVEIVSHFYDNLQNIFQRIAQLTVIGIESLDEEISFLSLECWNVVIDIERLRLDENIQNFGFISKYFRDLLNILMKKIKITAETKKIIDLCRTIEDVSEIMKEKLVETLPYLGSCILSVDLQEKICGIYVLGSILKGLPQTTVETILTQSLPTLEPFLLSSEISLLKSIDWFIYKVCDNWPEVCSVFPKVLEMLYFSLSKSFSKHNIDALLEVVDTGISLPNLQNFIETLLAHASASKYLNCFSVIRNVFEHLPKDHPMTVYYTNYFVNGLNRNTSAISSISTILRICFERMSIENLEGLYEKIFGLLENLPFTDEFLISITCLSRHQTHFVKFIEKYSKSLIYALSTPEHTKSGLISLAEIARNLEGDDYFPMYLPHLLKLFDTNAKPNIFLLEACSDLSGIHPYIMVEHVGELMKYAWYCMKYSIDNEKSEDEDFLEDLREVIVIFFEGFVQGLGGAEAIETIKAYIADIVKYCIYACAEKFEPTERVVASTLGTITDLLLMGVKMQFDPEIINFIKKYEHSENEILRVNAECVLSNL